MKNKITFKREHILYLILLAVIIFSILPWFQEGIPATDDFRHHITKLWWIDYSFENYGKFVEWMPFIYSGWPLTHFYHSLPYFITIPFLFMMGPVAAIKASIALSFILAALAMFFATKKLIGNNEIAALAAIFYTLMPMHFEFAYLSGSLSRLWAYVFIPLALVYFIKTIEKGSKKNIVLTGIFFAALVYTNISIAFTLSLVLLMYLIYYFFIKEKKIEFSKIRNLVFVVLIVLGLLSFWIIPLSLEKESSTTTKFIENVFGSNVGATKYSAIFTRDFGIKPYEGKSIRYWYLSFVLLFLAASSYFVKSFKYKNIFLSLVVLSLFIATNTWILKLIPFAKITIFYSHYFVLISIALLSIMAAVGTYSLSRIKKQHMFLGILLILVIFLIDVYPAQSTYNWADSPTENYLNNNQVLEAYDFVKNQEGLFRVYSFVGEMSYMYTEKPEIGLMWTGYREGAFKPIRDLTDEIYREIKKNVSNDRINKILGYMGTKYHIYPCIKGFNSTFDLAFSNKDVCVYENKYFEPLIESPIKLIISESPNMLEKGSAIILEKCEFDCIKEVKQTKISNVTFEPEEISFNTSGKGYVLVKSAYFKSHWYAYLNGEELEIKKAWPHYMFIEVPEGENKVKFKYETNKKHVISKLISVLTILFIVYLFRKELRIVKK